MNAYTMSICSKSTLPLGDEDRGGLFAIYYHPPYKIDQEQGSVIHIVNLGTCINQLSNLITTQCRNDTSRNKH